jgi:hypothetical protein
MAEPNHDPLLAELRRLAQEVDAVPDDVTAYARAALGWRRVDAELAELLSDSRLETGAALVRSGEARIRSVTFGGEGVEIAVEIHDRAPGIRIMGQLSPPLIAAVDVQFDDGTIEATVDSDELGRFRFDLERGGRLRLLIRRVPPAQPIETSWLDA